MDIVHIISYMLTIISTLVNRLFIKKYYTSITQRRFRMAQQSVIFIHCLYLAKLDPVLHIGDIVQ